MARTFQFTDGSTTVDLIDTDATGLIAQRHGFGDVDIPVGIQAGTEVVEAWTFNLKGSSHDNLASQLQTLTKLIRQAKEYREHPWRDTPVYLKAQLTNETNTRYSMVKEVVDYTIPDPYDLPVEANNELEGLRMTVVREHPWRSNAPGTLGSALTLDASDGPASPTLVPVANFRDDGDVTHVFHYDDSGTSFSSNLLSASTGTDLFPSSPAASDILYAGSTDIPPKHVVFDIATASDWNIAGKWQYYNGSSWTDMAIGTDYTLFGEGAGEVADDDTLFTTTGQWVLSVFPPSDWAKTSINSQNAFWVRYILTTVTSTTTVPEKSGDTIYSQRSPYVAIPDTSIKGDSPVKLNIRMYAPSGGDDNPGPASLSRIIIGAKSRGLTTFTPFLNAGGNDNPAAWTVNQDTDATSTADTAAAGNAHSLVDFSTDSTMVSRIEFVGDDILDDWLGEYRVFARIQQSGGSAGDINMKARFYLGGNAVSDPSFDTRERSTTGVDQGTEVLDLGFVALPFTRVYNADTSNIDLTIQLHAERTTGSANLEIHDLILMPLDEGAMAVDDFAVDVSTGSGALRGGSVLDIDNGLIANRTVKHWHDGTNFIPVSAWARMNRPIDLANVSTDTRLYFLMLHYATGAANWGEEPLIASTGNMVMVELFAHYGYTVLRGSD